MNESGRTESFCAKDGCRDRIEVRKCLRRVVYTSTVRMYKQMTAEKVTQLKDSIGKRSPGRVHQLSQATRLNASNESFLSHPHRLPYYSLYPLLPSLSSSSSSSKMTIKLTAVASQWYPPN